MLISKFQLGLVVALLAASSVGFVWEIRENAQLRREASARPSAKRLAELKQQLALQTKRAAAAEAEVAALLKAAKNTRAPSATRGPTDTQDFLHAVTTRASALIAEGKSQAALDEYVKAYRELEAKRPGSSECQSLMSTIKRLGRTYPPALEALARLRDDAMTQHQAHPEKHELAFEIALLNERLDQGARTIALYDSLPPNEIGRQSLAMIAFKSFVDAGRYADALVGKNSGQMMNMIDGGTRQLATHPELQNEIRRSIVDNTLTDIEVLTGAGQLDDARLLTEKLFAFDGSDATRSAVKEHVERAQQRAVK